MCVSVSIKVKLSGSHLTPQCYSFITYVQVSFCCVFFFFAQCAARAKCSCYIYLVISLQSGEINGGVNEKKKKRKEEEAVVAASVRIFYFSEIPIFI